MLQTQLEGHPLIYLDSAATALKPRQVIDAMSHYLSHHDAPVHRAAYASSRQATELYHSARTTLQQFINAASPNEIIFTRGTTDSINLLADSLRHTLSPGDEIYVSAMEHHSNLVPWQMLCAATGATLHRIPMDEQGELQLIPFSPRTRIVAVSHVSNVTGTINPIKQLAALAHAAGAYLVVDGAQAAGHLPINVRDLDCDFYAFSGHKMYGPTGIGILYGRESLLNDLPPTRGGGDMVQQVTFERSTYTTAPLKFEPGTPPTAQAIGLAAAAIYLTTHNPHGHEAQLLHQLLERLSRIPNLHILGSPRAPIVSFTIEGIHPLDLATLLSCRGIAIRSGHLCSQPTLAHFNVTHCCRASLGLYNSPSDIDHFINALDWALSRLRPLVHA
jgi:cysteine desulfurase/selenocysteine lyase